MFKKIVKKFKNYFFMSKNTKDIGIDLGTANILIYDKQ